MILFGFLAILIISRIITSIVVNKSLVKQVQAKETKILEKHIERSQNTRELANLDPQTIGKNLPNSEVMRRIEAIDLQKMEKKSRQAQKEIEQKEIRKEFRFIEREGNSISIDIA